MTKLEADAKAKEMVIEFRPVHALVAELSDALLQVQRETAEECVKMVEIEMGFWVGPCKHNTLRTECEKCEIEQNWGKSLAKLVRKRYLEGK